MAAHVHINLLCVSSSEQKAMAKGVALARVVVKGVGPGRLVSGRRKYVTFVSFVNYCLVMPLQCNN